ncbi:unnamed protein product [Vitrella brassicaformis CCMP3155]|uniref:Ribosomal protein L14 n=1 Tax=Vitrella brassicaformis (strain CCMP3155) TaxID=1169540 RepID=A0A0G4GLR4_VITBC|nr:unnamed protein product [Vitrella brassicaformis CCMP3155]|mmetsp:Transcript_24047/g.59449  ORF Transcript_24047/g.59449 Transcript_24047/m.59449 type:complete len:125 (-) Transcript_24047:1657-2031(-)|eukprot:CEM31020.1 unnamed protein product [Vitrella brassicaformis CCMP3155]
MLRLSPLLLGGVHRQTIMRCADNTGAMKVCVFGLGQNKRGTGKPGHLIRVSIRDKTPECTLGKTHKGMILRTKKEVRRKDGMNIKFDENAMVMIAKNKPVGSKIKGPTVLELGWNARNLCRYIF